MRDTRIHTKFVYARDTISQLNVTFKLNKNQLINHIKLKDFRYFTLFHKSISILKLHTISEQ